MVNAYRHLIKQSLDGTNEASAYVQSAEEGERRRWLVERCGCRHLLLSCKASSKYQMANTRRYCMPAVFCASLVLHGHVLQDVLLAASLWMGSGVLNAVAGRVVAKKAGNR